MKKTILDDPFLILHKYFITANLMKTQFNAEPKLKAPFNTASMAYMTVWYGCLFVVIEGWFSLQFKDKKIDELLQSENTKLLKGVRHDTFHFQKNYYPQRLLNFLEDKSSAIWVKELNKEFGRYFLNELKLRKDIADKKRTKVIS